MGLDFVVVEKPESRDSEEKYINSFQTNWFRDQCVNPTLTWETKEVNGFGDKMYTNNQLIDFGKYLIKLATNSDDYSKKYLFEFKKLELMTEIIQCTDESVKDYFIQSLHHLSKFDLIKTLIASEDLDLILDPENIYLSQSDRLIHFGLKLIEYGEQGYWGYWSY